LEEKRSGWDEMEQRDGLNSFLGSFWGPRGATNLGQGRSKSRAHTQIGIVREKMALRSRIWRVTKASNRSEKGSQAGDSHLARERLGAWQVESELSLLESGPEQRRLLNEPTEVA
jgi:hypothetical protein